MDFSSVDFNLNDFIIQFWDKYGFTVLEMGRKFLIAVLIIISGKVIISLSQHLIQKAVSGKIKFDEAVASVLRMVIKYGIVIICLIMILDVFGANTAGLIALLGAAGVAIGFALKDTLSNIAAGIIILFLHPFRKGDYIEFDTTAGIVCEMGLFATILETPDGIYICAPNSSLWGVPLKNYSHNAKRRLDITVSISYTNSIDSAFQVLKGIIWEENRFIQEPAPRVMVQSLGDSGLNVTLRAWVPSADYWVIYWDQMKNIKERLQEAGITISLPKREIHLIKDTRE